VKAGRGRDGSEMHYYYYYYYYYYYMANRKYTAVQVPREYRLVLLIKVGWKQGARLGKAYGWVIGS